MDSDEAQQTPEASEATTANVPAAAVILGESTAAAPPRLGIIHLLAWITISSVLFGIEKCVCEVENEKLLLYPEVIQILRFANLSLLSAGIVGIVTLLRWQLSGRGRPLAPGHWLLSAFAFPYFIGYCISMLRSLFFSQDLANSRFSSLTMLATWMLVYIVQFVIFVGAPLRARGEPGWRRIFIVLAFSRGIDLIIVGVSLMFFALHVSQSTLPGDPEGQYCGAIAESIAAVIFIAFATYDQFRVRRDWLHGLGVGLIVCAWLLSAGSWAAMRMSR